MNGGWRYRVVSVLGVGMLAVLAVVVANNTLVQDAFQLLPVVGELPFEPSDGGELAVEAGTTAAVVVGALLPLYKPRPRRILDVAMLSVQRTTVGLLALAAIGYFDYTYRLPRATLLVAGSVLLLTVPAWLVTIRQRPSDGTRTVLVGDDPATMEQALEAVDGPVLGYISPPNEDEPDREQALAPAGIADGGQPARPQTIDDLDVLGGLSRLDDVLIDYDIDTAVLAFRHADRGEFFGALDSCYEHGVTAKVHRDHADRVLVDDAVGGPLATIDLEPWDWQDYLFKRVFDVAFSASGLLLLSPVMAVIAGAIKLDSSGPVLYSQERTAEFGETFAVYKFRSMIPDAEAESGAKLSEEDAGGVDPRVTRVGRVLRATHLDEIPQLWSILVGDMSVVGPRPERPELDADIEQGIVDWRRRWFVKPGLTGLAQINDATGVEPDEKLNYDLQYIRKQSFWFDLKIVVRQIWLVVSDLIGILKRRGSDRIR